MKPLNDWEQEDVDNYLKSAKEKLQDLRRKVKELESDYTKVLNCDHRKRKHKGSFILNEVQCKGCGFTWYN